MKKNQGSAQLNMNFFLHIINVEMPSIVGVSTFMNKKIVFKTYLSPINAVFFIFTLIQI